MTGACAENLAIDQAANIGWQRIDVHFGMPDQRNSLLDRPTRHKTGLSECPFGVINVHSLALSIGSAIGR